MSNRVIDDSQTLKKFNFAPKLLFRQSNRPFPSKSVKLVTKIDNSIFFFPLKVDLVFISLSHPQPPPHPFSHLSLSLPSQHISLTLINPSLSLSLSPQASPKMTSKTPRDRHHLHKLFDGASITRTPKINRDYRDFIISKYIEDLSKRLTFTEGRKSLGSFLYLENTTTSKLCGDLGRLRVWLRKGLRAWFGGQVRIC